MRISFLNTNCNQYSISILVCVFFFSLPVCTSSAEADASQIPFTAGSDKSYSFTDVLATSQGSVISVSGRVKSAGKQLRGHIDIAIFDSSGILKKMISVKPYFNNRPGIGTINTIGFPFRTKIRFDESIRADKYTLRLVLHRESQHRDTVFDCGANEALH